MTLSPQCEIDKRTPLKKARHYVRAVFDLIQEFKDEPFILNEIDAALAQSDAAPWDLLQRAWLAIPVNRVELLEDIEAAFKKRNIALAQSDAEQTREERQRLAYKIIKAIRSNPCAEDDTLVIVVEQTLAANAVQWRSYLSESELKERHWVDEPLAQSDAEPVAWQVRSKGSPDWYIWQRDGNPSDNIDPEYYEARPLYTAPQPNTSGLIEAAGIALEFSEEGRFTPHEKLTEGMTTTEAYKLGISDAACWVAQDLRSRAADRSGK